MSFFQEMKLGEKVAFVLGCCAMIALIAVLLYPMVSAADTNKWTICAALNITGATCDDFWGNFTAQYQSNNTATPAGSVNQTELQTIIAAVKVNITEEIQKNLSANFYTKEQVFNRTEINSTPASTYITTSEFLNFRENFSAKYLPREEYILLNSDSDDEDSSNGISTPLIIMSVLLIALLVVLWKGLSAKKPTQYTAPSNNASAAMELVKLLRKPDAPVQQSPPQQMPPQSPPVQQPPAQQPGA